MLLVQTGRKTFFNCKNGTEGTKACFWYTKAKNGVT